MIQRNPANLITYGDGLILIGIGVIVGGLGYWLVSKAQSDSSGPTPIATGPDVSGAQTYATPPNAEGVAVFSNQTPGPLGPAA